MVDDEDQENQCEQSANVGAREIDACFPVSVFSVDEQPLAFGGYRIGCNSNSIIEMQ